MTNDGANAVGQDGPIILYDGVCGLCNRLVQFVLKRDRRDRFRFASLQSRFAAELLTRHGRDPQRLDSVYLVLDPGRPTERLLAKSRAVLAILRELGGPWSVLCVLGVLPTPILNLGYDAVARLRYRLFGRFESCLLPDSRFQSKFIEI